MAKTSLINRLLLNKFEENIPSILFSINYPKVLKLKIEKDIIINFTDTYGQEKFSSLTKVYAKNCDCIIMMYDITNRSSLENIKNYWYKTYEREAKIKYLVVNKIDLNEKIEVSEKEARDYAKEKNMKFFQISCKSSFGIKDFISDLVNELTNIEEIHYDFRLKSNKVSPITK